MDVILISIYPFDFMNGVFDGWKKSKYYRKSINEIKETFYGNNSTLILYYKSTFVFKSINILKNNLFINY